MLINKAVKRRVVTEPMFVSETVDRCDPETLLQPQQSAGGGGEGCGEEALAMGQTSLFMLFCGFLEDNEDSLTPEV